MGFLMADSYCNNVQRLKVAGDSKLAIDFMKSKATALSENLQPLVEGNKKLAKYFQSI